jgi:hypothetical protein
MTGVCAREPASRRYAARGPALAGGRARRSHQQPVARFVARHDGCRIAVCSAAPRWGRQRRGPLRTRRRTPPVSTVAVSGEAGCAAGSTALWAASGVGATQMDALMSKTNTVDNRSFIFDLTISCRGELPHRVAWHGAAVRCRTQFRPEAGDWVATPPAYPSTISCKCIRSWRPMMRATSSMLLSPNAA